jgi:hypothetical protein
MDESPTSSPDPRCILLVNGAVRVDSATHADAFRRTKEALGHLLQVRNLAVLLGAGASFHLGAPAIRHLSVGDIRALVATSGIELSEAADALLASLCGDEPSDLEALLASLSSIIAFASAVSADEVATTDGRSFSRDASTGLRLALNRALACACDIPRHTPGESQLDDPWRVHGAFFQR